MNTISEIPIWYSNVLMFSFMIAQFIILIVLIVAMRRQKRYKPFWQILQTEMASLLHHPHPESRELDVLLEELEAANLTTERRDRLIWLLNEKASDKNQGKDERNRAEFLLFAMREVVREKILNQTE